jgi:hypothetical protein
MDVPQNTLEPPIILCSISTSAATLNLALNQSIKITTTVTLHYAQPITLRRENPIFSARLRTPGLSFTNVESGNQVPRIRRNCVFRVGTSHLDPPSEENKNMWITLHPDQPVVLENTLAPELTRDACPIMPTSPKMIAKLGIQVKTMQWHDISGFENGERYEIGIEDGLNIKEWLPGDLEDILERKSSGADLVVRREAVNIEVRETAIFEMKRQDQDGYLNYGWRRQDAYEEPSSFRAPREKSTDPSRAAHVAELRKQLQKST